MNIRNEIVMTEVKKWGHNELQDDLAQHIRSNSDKMVWTDMPMGSVGNCRPDIFVIQKSFTKFRPIIYEVKISVNDFRSDITSGKWQKYLNYACGVIFAVPAGMIGKEDLPKGCGLIVRHDEIWRVAKAPTLQHLDSLPHELWLKLLMNGIERQTKLVQKDTFSRYAAETKIRKKFGENIGKLLGDLNTAERRLLLATENTKNLAVQIEQSHQLAIERARKEDANCSEIKSELCEFLGLPIDAHYREISNKCQELIMRLSENEEIERLTKLFGTVKSAIEKSEKPIPIKQSNLLDQLNA